MTYGTMAFLELLRMQRVCDSLLCQAFDSFSQGKHLIKASCLAVNYKPQFGTCEPQTMYSEPCHPTAQHRTASYHQQNRALNGQAYSYTPSSQYRSLITLLLPAHRKDRETQCKSDKGVP